MARRYSAETITWLTIISSSHEPIFSGGTICQAAVLRGIRRTSSWENPPDKW